MLISERGCCASAARVLALLALVAFVPACGTPVPSDVPSASELERRARDAAGLRREADTILRAYRQVIVLMAGERTLPAADRPYAFAIGRLLFEENVPRQRGLSDRLVAELDAASASGFRGPLTLISAFLDPLESEPSWHDGDKLAFRDTLTTLAGRLATLAPASPAGKALQLRFEEDRKALEQIQALYEKELDAAFGQFRKRGMVVNREAWDSYVTFLRTLFTPQGVMNERRKDVAALVPPPEPAAPGVLPDKTLVLTFDDGPHARFTPEILDVLDRHGLKSIFFQLGTCLGKIDPQGDVHRAATADVCARIVRDGHLVGNHTNTHPFLPTLSVEKIDQELDLTSKLIEAADEPQPALFRPPYGAVTDSVRAEAAARKMQTMLWSIDSQDWADPVAKSVADRVIRAAEERQKGIILMHDIHRQSVDALPLIIEALQADGFRFVLWDGQQVTSRSGRTAESSVPPPPAAPAMPPLYRASHAVVIGINDYEKWPKLGYARSDALAVRDALVNQFRFPPENVITLIDRDATRERIVSALGDTLADPKKVSPDDRVLVFFAGHGATRALPSGRSLGYIIPVDAGIGSLEGQAISMTAFQDINDSIPAKHVLYVMDACYGGLALVRGGPTDARDTRRFIAEITRRPARQMVTAGGPDEQVADNGPEGHSIFTWTLLQGLGGKADANADGYITATELFSYAAPLVSELSHQTPAFGSLVGSQGGEFVFELAHQAEDLSGVSKQLDDEGIALNAQLDAVRREIEAKRARNGELKRQLDAAKSELATLDGAPSSPAPRATSWRTLNDAGLAAFREKKYDVALAKFQAAFAANERNAQIANNIGFVYFRLDRYDDALTWYGKALAIDPNRAIAYANAADAHAKLGHRADAIAGFEKFLALAPQHADAPYVRKRLAEVR